MVSLPRNHALQNRQRRLRAAGVLLFVVLCALPAQAQPSDVAVDRGSTPASTSASPTSTEPANLESLLALTTEDILRLTPGMQDFVDQNIGREQVKATRLRSLIHLIFSPDGLGVTYGNTRTKSAEETFQEASGNCLSFTLMFVTMARSLGLDAYFVEVSEVTSWNSKADVDINAWHMFAEVGLDNGYIQVDFLPGIDKRYLGKRRIRDDRVVAHYFNNLGVEALTSGDLPTAHRLLQRSLEQDRHFLPALVNLGVIERRAGNPEAAEKAFLDALALDRSNLQAARNLASLYNSTGRAEKAKPLLDRVARYLDRNPYHHYRLSQKAMAAERWGEAAEHLEKAIRRRGDVSQFHSALAEVWHHLGEPEKADDELVRAIRFTDDEGRRALLAARRTAWRPES